MVYHVIIDERGSPGKAGPPLGKGRMRASAWGGFGQSIVLFPDVTSPHLTGVTVKMAQARAPDEFSPIKPQGAIAPRRAAAG